MKLFDKPFLMLISSSIELYFLYLLSDVDSSLSKGKVIVVEVISKLLVFSHESIFPFLFHESFFLLNIAAYIAIEL